MANQRPAIPYTVTTLPLNGIVTQQPWQGLQDAITSIHQRGKVVVSAHSQIYRDVKVPLLGIVQFSGGLVYSGPKEIPIRFQIPAGYDRFCMLVAYQFPPMTESLTVNSRLIHAAIDFRSGESVHRVFEKLPVAPYSHTYNVQLIDGLLPVQANTGTVVSAVMSLYFNVANVNIGTGLTQAPGKWHGFDYLTMALYRNDEC